MDSQPAQTGIQSPKNEWSKFAWLPKNRWLIVDDGSSLWAICGPQGLKLHSESQTTARFNHSQHLSLQRNFSKQAWNILKGNQQLQQLQQLVTSDFTKKICGRPSQPNIQWVCAAPCTFKPSLWASFAKRSTKIRMPPI
jgi:hypothetical protein